MGNEISVGAYTTTLYLLGASKEEVAEILEEELTEPDKELLAKGEEILSKIPFGMRLNMLFGSPGQAVKFVKKAARRLDKEASIQEKSNGK